LKYDKKWGEPLNQILKVLKNQKPEMDEVSVFVLLSEEVSKKLSEVIPREKLEDINGSLASCISPEALKDLKRQVIEKLEGFPYKYTIFVPLRQVKRISPPEVQITKNLKIKILNKETIEQFSTSEKDDN